mgnify:CR=1 FL=1
MVKKALEKLKDREINQEAWVKGMTEEEAMLVPKKMTYTVEEFAKTTEGHTLSILYKNGEQRGYVVLTSTDRHSMFPISGQNQDIQLIIDTPPADGVVCFDLKPFQK